MMERFRYLNPETLHDAIREMMAENPDAFVGVNSVDVLLFIREGQYLANAMFHSAEVCATRPGIHVWELIDCNEEECAGCGLSLQTGMRGLKCKKCFKKIHFFCYKYIRPCRLAEHNYFSTYYSHLFTTVITDGFCETCYREISLDNVAKMCAFCGLVIHIKCGRASLNTCGQFSSIPRDQGALGIDVIDPLLVFVNPLAADGYGGTLMHQFVQALNPMQVINVRATDPVIGFERFANYGPSNVIVVGGDKVTNYILRTFLLMRRVMYEEPTFRFIPLGAMAEIGRSFGGRIRYSTKTARYILRQLTQLSTYNFCPWQVFEIPTSEDSLEFSETFYYSFALGVETFIDLENPQPERRKQNFWSSLTHVSNPLDAFRRWRRRNAPDYTPDTSTLPVLDDFISLEINGESVDLTEERYLAIVLVNRIIREDDFPGILMQPEINDDEIDIYGITHYFKLTRKNLMTEGIKLGQSNNVRIIVKKNLPFLADGYSGLINFTGDGVVREFNIRQVSPLKIMAVQGEYNPDDRPLLRRHEREDENTLLDRSECFVEQLERGQREPEMRRERAWFQRRVQERIDAEERAAAERREENRRTEARREAETREAERREAEEREEEEEQRARGRLTETKKVVEEETEGEVVEQKAADREDKKRTKRKAAHKKYARKKVEVMEVVMEEPEKEIEEERAAEREEAERRAAEREEAEREEAERIAAEREEAERRAAEREEAEKKAAEREEAKRRAAEREEAERRAAEREEAEKKAAEREEAEKKAADKKHAKKKVAVMEAAEMKVVEPKAADKEEVEKKAADKKHAKKKVAVMEAAEMEVVEPKAADKEEVEKKAADKKHAKKKVAVMEAVEPKAADKEEVEKKAVEEKDAEQKAAEEEDTDKKHADKEEEKKEATEKEAEEEAAKKAAEEAEKKEAKERRRKWERERQVFV